MLKLIYTRGGGGNWRFFLAFISFWQISRYAPDNVPLGQKTATGEYGLDPEKSSYTKTNNFSFIYHYSDILWYFGVFVRKYHLRKYSRKDESYSERPAERLLSWLDRVFIMLRKYTLVADWAVLYIHPPKCYCPILFIKEPCLLYSVIFSLPIFTSGASLRISLSVCLSASLSVCKSVTLSFDKLPFYNIYILQT